MRVLHLAGSAADDFYAELSRTYAQDCLIATADPARYAFHPAFVTPDGHWRFPDDFDRASVAAAETVALPEAVARIVALDIEVAVPQMFCIPGMTTYRALFDLARIPYVGNRPEVMAACAHKPTARALVAAAGVAVPAGELIGPDQVPRLPTPAVVKPADADNSLGVTLVRERIGYAAAVATALEHSDRALVETYVEAGREVRCGVVEHDGHLVCLPLEEYPIDPVERPVRRASDKLSRRADDTVALEAKQAGRAWIVPVDDPITQDVWAAARRCFAALRCRHHGLFDFRVDAAGRPWFLEAGPYSSFARTSVITTMAEAGGIGLDELFAAQLRLATGS